MGTVTTLPSRRVTYSLGLMALAVALTACGGNSGSVTASTGSAPGPGAGGSSGIVVQGQILRTTTAAGESRVMVAFRTVLGIGLAEAQEGAPLAGATVTLVGPAGPVAQTTTDSRGGFIFSNVPPGSYTVQVSVNGSTQTIVFSDPSPLVLGVGDTATIVGRVTAGGVPGTVAVVASSTDVVNNDAQLGHAINIDRASASCDFDQVISLRNQGLGWGVIARRCDAPPGVIGLGRTNLTDGDVDDARNRANRGRGRGPQPNPGRGNGRPA